MKDGTVRNACKSVIENCIKEMEKQIVGEKLKNLQHDMDRIFEDKLNERIVQGAGQAKIKAEAIARKWGDKVRLLCNFSRK